MKRLLLSFITASGLLSGCAFNSTPRYDNSQDKNLTINVKTDERSGFFSSVDIAAGVNDLDNKCQTNYRGYIKLKPGKNQIGLAPGVRTYINVEVALSRSSSSSSYARGTILKPVKGHKYEIDVNYIDNMYDFRLYEIVGSQRKPLPSVKMNQCQSL